MTLERAIDWGTQPLGKVPDIEIARQLGVPNGVVWRERQCRGIPAFRPQPELDWDAQPLGKVPDVELAQRLGVSNHVVGRARQQRGIAKTPRYWARDQKLDWDAQPLGEETDVLVARTLGVSKFVVLRERQKRGIAAPPKVNKARRREWDNEPLGCEEDSVIAQRLNVSPETVANERKRRGIPAFRPGPQIDWDAQPLGKVPDTSLAIQLGVSVFVVLRARQKRGIAAPPRNNRSLAARHQARRREWDNEPLGCEEDASIAQRMKVTPVTVAKQRQRRGIQPFRSKAQIPNAQRLGEHVPMSPKAKLAPRVATKTRHLVLDDVYAFSSKTMDALAALAAIQINTDQVWVDERARYRLLEAFGELTLADLDDTAIGCSL
jgi:hypothetical protein